MHRLKMPILMVTFILMVNYYQFGANAFDHVVFHPNFHNGKNNQELHETISINEDGNHIVIYPNGRHKRYDTVQNIDQYINDERRKFDTKRHIQGSHNTATESILPLNQNVKGNFQTRRSKSQIESYPPRREYLPTNRAYLPPSRKYLPPSREILPPSLGYLPVLEDHATEATPTSIASTIETTTGSLDLMSPTMTETETTLTATATTVEPTSSSLGFNNPTMTTDDIITEEDVNIAVQTPIHYITTSSAVPKIESKSAGHTNEPSTITKIESNLTVKQETLKGVQDSNSTVTNNSATIKPDLENNNCSDITESGAHHEEAHLKKYDHVVHHYHHIYHHYYGVPHIDYLHHDASHIDYHHCGEDSSTTTTMKPCCGCDNSKHKQHVRKHKVYSYPSNSYYPHFPSYPHFSAYPHYSPIAISYVPDEDN